LPSTRGPLCLPSRLRGHRDEGQAWQDARMNTNQPRPEVAGRGSFPPTMFAPIPLQRIEGLALLVLGVIGFASADASWWWLIGLLLVPDLSMIGYLANPSMGATIYNAGHTLLGPGLLFAWHWRGGPTWVLVAATVWLVHIGMDRLFGYGLKFGDDFTHTHLGPIGADRRSGYL